jgi:hypothetical protein
VLSWDAFAAHWIELLQFCASFPSGVLKTRVPLTLFVKRFQIIKPTKKVDIIKMSSMKGIARMMQVTDAISNGKVTQQNDA